MHTFLTPEPITIEIRNASGDVRVDLADVTTSTVDVVAGSSHPFGFIDDVVRAAKAQFGSAKTSAGGYSGAGPFYDEQVPDDPAERVRVDLQERRDSEGAATLIVDTDPAREGWRSSFTVHVTAPTDSGVRIQTQSADIVVTGRAERLESRTASGDVRIDHVNRRAVVQTASGDVTIAQTAECDVRTASGDIEVRRATTEAVVHSTSGDIRLDAPAGNINARSVSGDVRLLDAASGRAEIVTVSGDVEVGVHAGALVAIDLSTVSGSTDNDFDVIAEPPGPDVVDADLTDAPVSENQGAALNLRVKTTSGDIRLRRAVAV